MVNDATRDHPVVLVTGGAGFLGRAIVRELQKPARAGVGTPAAEIRVFDKIPLDPKPFALREDEGLVSLVGDLRSAESVREACRGVDAVIHTASLVDWGHASEQVLHDINVVGTRNIIDACRAEGVPALVYTSTMDVVYPRRPIRNGDETLPYPKRFADAYAHSKALAEQSVLAANSDSLATCAIRPCGMWGEADPYHVSQTLRLAEAGKLSHRIGNGKAQFQHVYVGNVAHGHLLAMQALLSSECRSNDEDTHRGRLLAAGEVYIITDEPSENFFDFLDPILTGLGHPMPPKSKYIPFALAWSIGAALELGARLARPFVTFRPNMTRSSVQILCQDFTFTSDKAHRELGYEPVYSKAEGLERTLAHFSHYGPNA
jgi:nucleoside-diphosphate-sugar epimerase